MPDRLHIAIGKVRPTSTVRCLTRNGPLLKTVTVFNNNLKLVSPSHTFSELELFFGVLIRVQLGYSGRRQLLVSRLMERQQLLASTSQL